MRMRTQMRTRTRTWMRMRVAVCGHRHAAQAGPAAPHCRLHARESGLHRKSRATTPRQAGISARFASRQRKPKQRQSAQEGAVRAGRPQSRPRDIRLRQKLSSTVAPASGHIECRACDRENDWTRVVRLARTRSSSPLQPLRPDRTGQRLRRRRQTPPLRLARGRPRPVRLREVPSVPDGVRPQRG